MPLQVRLALSVAQKVSRLRDPKASAAPQQVEKAQQRLPGLSYEHHQRSQAYLVSTPLLEGVGLGYQLRLMSLLGQNPELEPKESQD